MSVENEKKTIRIKIMDFWASCDFENTTMCHILRKHYNIEYCNNPDFIICSIFGKERSKYDAVSLCYSGENASVSLLEHDYAIDFDDYEYIDRHYCMPIWFWRDEGIGNTKAMKTKHQRAEELFKEKKAFCSLVSSHHTPQRHKMLDALNEYKRVDCAGNVGHNVDIPSGIKAVVDFESTHKFSIAFEHSSREDYITEKLVQSFAAGTIPIYWGAPNVTKYFNPDAMIVIKDESDIPTAVDRIKEIDNNDELYLNMLRQPALVPGAEKRIDEFLPGLERFLLNIFDQEPAKARRRGTASPDAYDYNFRILRACYLKKN